MYSLVQALENIFKGIGGIVDTDTEVEQIVIENRGAKGVLAKINQERDSDIHVKGTRSWLKFYEADAVISNADLAHTYGELIKSEHRRKWSDKKLRKIQYSMSAFLLYLGVRKKYPQLKHHTLILSERYKRINR